MNRLLVSLVVMLLSGCAGEEPPSLSGEVTLDGQPLPAGFVICYGPAEGCVAAGIRQGRYEILNPPLGEVTLVVSDASSPTLPGWKPDLKSYLPGSIPALYLSRDTSPLKLVVKAGRNRFDIAMIAPR